MNISKIQIQLVFCLLFFSILGSLQTQARPNKPTPPPTPAETTTPPPPTQGEEESVVELQFSQIERFKGFYATVIYGINNNLFISGSTNVHLNYITAQSSTQSIQSDSLAFPSIKIPAPQGVWEAYNAIILVIHRQPQFQWVNADNSIPAGGAIGNDHSFRAVYALSKREYLKLLQKQENKSPLNISYPRR